jgi:site-specific recombinase XerC
LTSNVAYLDESTAAGWERTLYVFLAEKERRSGSLRTVQSCQRMLRDFFGRSAKTPDRVEMQDVFAWAYGVGLSGRQPSSITIGARLACVSSFYRFLIRMKVVSSNPCDPLERPKALPGTPRGLTAGRIKQLLDVVPATPVGLRDRAIILTLVMAGRRRTEVMDLKASNILVEDRVYYTYRGKGGKTGKRELPPPAVEAINAWLAASGRSLVTMAPNDSLWPDLRTGTRDHKRDLLHQSRSVPERCGLAARRRTHLPSQRREAPARCRRDGRGCVEPWTTAAWR